SYFSKYSERRNSDGYTPSIPIFIFSKRSMPQAAHDLAIKLVQVNFCPSSGYHSDGSLRGSYSVSLTLLNGVIHIPSTSVEQLVAFSIVGKRCSFQNSSHISRSVLSEAILIYVYGLINDLMNFYVYIYIYYLL